MFPNDEIVQSDPEIAEIERRTQKELAQLQNYEKVFAETHPRPDAPEYVPYVISPFIKTPFDDTGRTFFEEKGVEAAVNALATAGGIAFSAIRTAGIFAIAEAKLLSTYGIDSRVQTGLSFLAGASIIAIVEGVLAGFGWIRGKASGKINTSWTPIVVAGLIGALAGILPTFELLPGFDQRDDIYLAILIALVLLSGPGITYLVYIVTENFGVIHNAWQFVLTEDKKKHEMLEKLEEDRYLAKEEAKERETYERYLSQYQRYEAGILAWEAAKEDDYRRKGRSLLFGEDSYIVKRRSAGGSASEITEEDEKEVQSKVVAWLEEHNTTAFNVGIQPGDEISPKALAIKIGADPARVRTALSRIRKTGR